MAPSFASQRPGAFNPSAAVPSGNNFGPAARPADEGSSSFFQTAKCLFTACVPAVNSLMWSDDDWSAEPDFEVHCTPGAVRYKNLVGNTPLLDLTSLLTTKVPGVKLYAKAEFMNPSFSTKDRIMAKIFNQAERRGELRPGMTVVCASSGNTGAACAMMCGQRGYRCLIITSESCSMEKRNTIRAYGAQLLVARPGEDYIKMEKDLVLENECWFGVNQFDNPSNPLAHYESTGPEIWHQTQGQVTHFVAAGGTGGTVSGTGRFLKEASGGAAKVVLADPHGSVLHKYWERLQAGEKNPDVPPLEKFLVEGVGQGNIPSTMDFSVVDDVACVGDKEAFSMCARLAREEGLFVGGSCGMNVHAAVQLANSLTEPGVVVTILCDNGVKYLSKVYNPEWLAEKGVAPPTLDSGARLAAGADCAALSSARADCAALHSGERA